MVETQSETLDTISGSLLPPSGTAEKPRSTASRLRTPAPNVGGARTAPRGPEGEGYAASHWATISAGSGHAPTPKVPRHGSPSRHHRRLLDAARDRPRPGSPVVVAVTGGRSRRTRPRRAQRDASRGGDPGLGCDTPVSPPTAAS